MGTVFSREHHGQVQYELVTGWMILVVGRPGKPQEAAEHMCTHTQRKMPLTALPTAGRDFLGASTGFYKQAHGAGAATYPPEHLLKVLGR